MRITRGLVKLLQERTADGYVFRVDLRLRPDPASTQIAVSTEAALNYYGSVGQNWERAALIKARACAGDIAAGEAILQQLAPVHLAEVSRLRRGRRHRGDEAADPRLPRPRGHRGRGPQHQARPRRHPRDRVLRADPAADRRRPASRAARPRDARRRSTRWPRAAGSAPTPAPISTPPIVSCAPIEHRLQMVADDQTHTLPSDREGLERFARFAGFKDRDAFAEALVDHLRKVQRHYVAAVRGHVGARPISRRCRSPRTPTTARRSTGSARMGFRKPLEVSATVRRWLDRRLSVAARRIRPHANSPSSCRCCSTGWRARKIRTPRSPPSTSSSAGCSAAARLFSLLKQNPDLVTLVALTLGTAPRLADILARYPEAMDALLEPTFFGALPDEAKLEAELQRTLERGALLRGPSRPAAHVRPGADVPDRRAHPVGHGVGRAGRRGVCAARRRRDPRAAPQRSRTRSPKATAASGASRPRCSRSASSAAAR